MQKKVLVIGGAGYVGAHTVLALKDAGYTPVVFDNFSAGQEKNLVQGIAVIRGSYLDDTTLRQVFSEPYYAVLHIAALKAAGVSMAEPSVYAKQNIAGTIYLLDYVLKQACPFIFSSSAAVYGEPKFVPVTEAHPTEPINFYGFTKLIVEQILQWYFQLKGLDSVSLRYFNVAGYDKALRITGLEQSPANVLPILFEAALGLRPHFTVFGKDYPTPDGTALRDYIHVSDIAHAHVLAIESTLRKPGARAYNLGANQALSVLELTEAVKKVMKRDFPVQFAARRPGDAAELWASSALAEQELGWKATQSDLDSLVSTHAAVYHANFP